jgi:predicted O-methyltransferase YrrM
LTTLYAPKVEAVLKRLFATSAIQEAAPPVFPPGFSFATASPQDRADAMAGVYMPVSARGGNLLYSLVRAARPQTIVEFGTSFGISTIYLASAVADNGSGHVLGTELSTAKVAAARANLASAGLEDLVTILAGDALQTLRDLSSPIGLVLLDGWKDMNLPLLKLLEPRLADGALVIGDDIDLASMTDYLIYVRNPINGYVSVAFPVDDGMEISCRATRCSESARSAVRRSALLAL